MLRLKDLQCFVTVYERRSFSRAADALDTVQSQISARIGRLEQELGAPLFVRLHRGVEPTDRGDLAYQYAQRVLQEVVELESAFGRASEFDRSAG